MTITLNWFPWHDGGTHVSDALAALDAALLERGHVRVRQEGSVVRVLLDRPDARNAQTPSTWAALAAVGQAVVEAGESVAAVIVSGSGLSFSAGLDRRMFTPEGIPGEMSLLSLASAGPADLDASIAAAQSAFTWWRSVDAVTVAAVQGHAIGAGFQLALACDLLIASEDAQFAMRETSYGLVPDLAGTWPLVRAIGYSRALDLCASGRTVTAAEGYALGFVTRVVADLDTEITALIGGLEQAPPGAVRDLVPLLRDAEVRTPEQQWAAERAAQAQRLRSLLSALGG